MDVVKKNLLSIIFGVIALLAVAALFYPIDGMYKDFQTNDLDKEAAKYPLTIQQITEERLLPVMPALHEATGGPQTLKDKDGRSVFPNPEVIAAGNQAVEEVKAQSLALVKAAEDCNIHQPLVAGVLPDAPSDRVFDFRKAYQDQFLNTLPTLLDATAPPSSDEIDAQSKDLWTKEYYPRIYTIEGKAANEQEVNNDFKQATLLLPLQMRDDRALKFKIYLLPDALSINTALTGDKTPTPEQVWFAQLSLWVEQDVATSIADANKSSDNVTHAPVKQLVKLDIAQDPSVYVTEQDLKNGGGAPPPPGGATPGTDFAISPTGRVSNALYDVVHFTLVLNVDANRLTSVLASLERSKLVTVLQVDAASVDSTAALDDGFVFGKAPVVQVTLHCESLFLRSWIDALMPASLRQLIHGGGPGGPGGGGPGGGGFNIPGGPMGPGGYGQAPRRSDQ